VVSVIKTVQIELISGRVSAPGVQQDLRSTVQSIHPSTHTTNHKVRPSLGAGAGLMLTM